MKIEKLPSGSYRIRKMYKGKTYTVIFDKKPTQKEALKAIAEELDKVHERHTSMTFSDAADSYIESKRNVLSPATIRGYQSSIKSISDKFKNKNIHDINAISVQTEINILAVNHSPKTVRNYHGFISAVLGTFCPNLKVCTTLPQKVKNEPYIPSDQDVKAVLEYAKDTEYEIPIILACYGLRRSEICALTVDDLDGDIVKVNKAMVLNEKNEWIIKPTKTTSSTRNIIIPMDVVDKIKKNGYIYNGHPNSLTLFLTKTENLLGIPHFSIHKLRHYFASKMSALNIPEADIMRMGGWETDHVMKSVYRHSMIDKEEQSKRRASEKLKSVLFEA